MPEKDIPESFFGITMRDIWVLLGLVATAGALFGGFIVLCIALIVARS